MFVWELVLWVVMLTIFITFSICATFTIVLAISQEDYFFASVMIFLEISFILLALDTFLLNGAICKAIISFLETEI